VNVPEKDCQKLLKFVGGVVEFFEQQLDFDLIFSKESNCSSKRRQQEQM